MQDEENAISYLQRALDNPLNERSLVSSYDMQYQKIKAINDLNAPHAARDFLTSLKDYRLVDDLCDLREGSYTRWITLRDGDYPELVNGGVLVKCVLNDHATLLLKNGRKLFQCNMANCLVFQKLTNQELVIQSAMELL